MKMIYCTIDLSLSITPPFSPSGLASSLSLHRQRPLQAGIHSVDFVLSSCPFHFSSSILLAFYYMFIPAFSAFLPLISSSCYQHLDPVLLISVSPLVILSSSIYLPVCQLQCISGALTKLHSLFLFR